MAVYIMREVIPFASGVCVMRGQLTAFVRAGGKVIYIVTKELGIVWKSDP